LLKSQSDLECSSSDRVLGVIVTSKQ
jgi:hypothetical protein